VYDCTLKKYRPIGIGVHVAVDQLFIEK